MPVCAGSQSGGLEAMKPTLRFLGEMVEESACCRGVISFCLGQGRLNPPQLKQLLPVQVREAAAPISSQEGRPGRNLEVTGHLA